MKKYKVGDLWLTNAKGKRYAIIADTKYPTIHFINEINGLGWPVDNKEYTEKDVLPYRHVFGWNLWDRDKDAPRPVRPATRSEALAFKKKYPKAKVNIPPVKKAAKKAINKPRKSK